MSKRFDELFDEICAILRDDWAGTGICREPPDLRYYTQAIGQAWHDNELNDLLFLQYISQMFACTGDRHLRFSMCPSEAYTPSYPGFFTRRFENALYVTAVYDDDRLSVGDRIIRVNGGTPEEHRRLIQKNFFYADEPEREDWSGLLKMADHIDVIHVGGREERLSLRRSPTSGRIVPPLKMQKNASYTILDLRNTAGPDEDTALSLLPGICRKETPLSALIDTDYLFNYSRRNCIVRSAAFQDIPGAEPFIKELAEKAGQGYIRESIDDGSVVIPEAGDRRVIVLTDTWTGGSAELLALAARRAGGYLIGRPTMGTLDLSGDISYAIDDRYVISWPTAITCGAAEGQKTLGTGIMPDLYIPWTPAECSEDILMKTALDLLK